MAVEPVTPLSRSNVGFHELYHREHDAQVRRAAILLRSDDAANDVVHDAMVEVYRRWDSLRDPGAYLNIVVLNRCRDHLRRMRRSRLLQQRLAGRTEAVEQPELLGDLFDRLPFKQRAALVLRYYADLSTADIAAALDCPQGSVGPWIDRALTTLKEQLP